VPFYDYFCPTCDETFEKRLSFAEVGSPVSCPAGHEHAKRKLAVFASVGSATGQGAPAPSPRTGGGCGSHCGCAH
jgi:putative FmdB family regulatory protein